MHSSKRHPYNLIPSNERGVVLILCLMMLLLLSILGAFATSTSMTELSIAGNFRTADIALNTAEAAVTRAETDPTIYAGIGVGSWGPSTIAVDNYTATGVTVTFVAAGLPPIGSGVDANLFQANYFVVSAQGNGPNNSQARIETQIAKIVPK